MAFSEELFPRRISAYARGGPVFKTAEARQPNGFRVTNRERLLPLHEYEFSHALRSGVNFAELRAFFYVHFGKADGFRFEAPDDNAVIRAESSLTLISGSIWQLNKTYTFGARTFTRPIYKPRAGVVVYDSGGTSLTATVSTTNGRATVTGTPVTWAGRFDVPCAFADDEALFTLIGGPNMVTEWPEIRVREIREVFA